MNNNQFKELEDKALNQIILYSFNHQNVIDVSAWINRRLRILIAEQMLDTLLNLNDEYDQDLVYTTYLSDSSLLCQPFQNKIFSQNGINSKYQDLNSALWRNGGGLLHPNCRHSIEPYFEGYSELDIKPNKVEKKQIEKENYNRTQWVLLNSKLRKQKEKLNKLQNMNDTKKQQETIKLKIKQIEQTRNKYNYPNDSAWDM